MILKHDPWSSYLATFEILEYNSRWEQTDEVIDDEAEEWSPFAPTVSVL